MQFTLTYIIVVILEIFANTYIKKTNQHETRYIKTSMHVKQSSIGAVYLENRFIVIIKQLTYEKI